MSDLDKQLTTDVTGSGETPAPVAEVSESVETKVPETEQEYRDFLASVGVSVRKNASMEALVAAYEEYQQSHAPAPAAAEAGGADALNEQVDAEQEQSADESAGGAGTEQVLDEEKPAAEEGGADGQGESDGDQESTAAADTVDFPVTGTVHNLTISDCAFPELGKQPGRFIKSGGSAAVKFDNADQLNKFQLNIAKLRVLNSWKAGVGIILELEGA